MLIQRRNPAAGMGSGWEDAADIPGLTALRESKGKKPSQSGRFAFPRGSGAFLHLQKYLDHRLSFGASHG